MKVTIIGGAGVVGASAAYRIAMDNTASEIVLVDINQNLAEAHALDIEQAVVHRSPVLVRRGELPDTSGSQLIIMTAGVPHRSSAASRSDFLLDNVPIVAKLTKELVRHSPNAMWLVATVPVDPLVFLLHKTFKIPPRKIFGLNRNDTCRLKWAISKVLSVASKDLEAFVLGEHGESQVPVFSHVFLGREKVHFTSNQIQDIRKLITCFFVDWNRLQPGRTAGWTSAESIGDILCSINRSDGALWPCSTPLFGEYGFSDVSLGVPVRFNREGIEEISILDLEEHEQAALQRSGEVIRQQIEQGESIISTLIKEEGL